MSFQYKNLAFLMTLESMTKLLGGELKIKMRWSRNNNLKGLQYLSKTLIQTLLMKNWTTLTKYLKKWIFKKLNNQSPKILVTKNKYISAKEKKE